MEEALRGTEPSRRGGSLKEGTIWSGRRLPGDGISQMEVTSTWRRDQCGGVINQGERTVWWKGQSGEGHNLGKGNTLVRGQSGGSISLGNGPQV